MIIQIFTIFKKNDYNNNENNYKNKIKKIFFLNI